MPLQFMFHLEDRRKDSKAVNIIIIGLNSKAHIHMHTCSHKKHTLKLMHVNLTHHRGRGESTIPTVFLIDNAVARKQWSISRLCCVSRASHNSCVNSSPSTSLQTLPVSLFGF